MPPVSRSNPTDQFAITSAPIKPASGSIQSQPNARASSSPIMTKTDTPASASDMNDGGPHIVVAVMRAMRSPVIVLFEFQFAFVWLAFQLQPDFGKEGMRFRNLIERLQISAPVLERK